MHSCSAELFYLQGFCLVAPTNSMQEWLSVGTCHLCLEEPTQRSSSSAGTMPPNLWARGKRPRVMYCKCGRPTMRGGCRGGKPCHVGDRLASGQPARLFHVSDLQIIHWDHTKAIRQANKRLCTGSCEDQVIFKASTLPGFVYLSHGKQLMFTVSNLRRSPPHPLCHQLKPLPWASSGLSAP